MGREFGSAVLRWHHLTQPSAKPVIVSASSGRLHSTEWFRDLGTVDQYTTDYRELLARDDINAVYCAVPHNLHRDMYIDIIRSGKALMAEKPFGRDLEANTAILAVCREHPEVFVRCSSEYPFFPASWQLTKWIEAGKFGRILEVRAGFNHCSDMDLDKPINWKRMARINGEYGCMGDLGLHIQHIPFRMGFIPKNVYACLSNYVTERSDASGARVPCDTWDNAMMLCDATNRAGDEFPIYFDTKRMKPGSTNEWYLEVYGLDCAARYTTDDPNAFHYTESWGKEQAWCRIDIGFKPQFPTVTGGIFQFGFTDSILQMWAAFVEEFCGNAVAFGCARPEETRLSHLLHTAALKSNRRKAVVALSEVES